MLGRDLLATATTGSGKTAAFLLPILHKLIDERRGTTRWWSVRATRGDSPRVTPVGHATGDITTIGPAPQRRPRRPRSLMLREGAAVRLRRSGQIIRGRAARAPRSRRRIALPWPAASAVTISRSEGDAALRRGKPPGHRGSAHWANRFTVMSARLGGRRCSCPAGVAVLVRQTLVAAALVHLVTSNLHSRASTTSPASSPIHATSRSWRKRRTASCLP